MLKEQHWDLKKVNKIAENQFTKVDEIQFASQSKIVKKINHFSPLWSNERAKFVCFSIPKCWSHSSIILFTIQNLVHTNLRRSKKDLAVIQSLEQQRLSKTQQQEKREK